MPRATSKPTDVADRLWAQHFAAAMMQAQPPKNGKSVREIAAVLGFKRTAASRYCCEQVALGHFTRHKIKRAEGGFVDYFVPVASPKAKRR